MSQHMKNWTLAETSCAEKYSDYFFIQIPIQFLYG